MSVAASALVLSAASQRSPSSGPFTAEQATSGRGLFQANCAVCHGADLSGGPSAPPLAGRAFAEKWSRRTTRDLVDAIRTMPPTSAGVLGDPLHIAIAAYILQSNGVASGPRPLTVTTTDAISSFSISRSSTAAAPESSLARPACPAQAGGSRETASASARARSRSDWPLYGGSATNQRYSTLAQITASNVKALGGAWMTRLPGPTNQTAVTMSHGRIFVATLNCAVTAMDAKTGQIVWVYELTEPPARRGVVAGADLGFVFVAGNSGTITAINVESGKRMWAHTLAPDPAHGRPANITSAPSYANGVVLVSISGGDSGRRGGVSALDAETGAERWRFYAIPGPGEPGYETWPDNEMWRAGGGAVWSPAAVDPELGLVYFGTGNPNGNPKGLEGQHPTQHPGPHPSHAGDLRPGDALFAASVVALDLKTGKHRWHFQLTRHDIWDMDVATPPVLYDTTVGGRPRKGIAVMRTDGYLFLFDRADGSPLLPIEERPVPQDPYQVTSPTQPFPVGGDQVVPNCIEPWLVPPGFKPGCYFIPLNEPNVMAPYIGARQAPMAYSPQTGFFYVASSVDPWWATRFGISHTEPGQKFYGLITAVDSRTNKIVWQQRSPYPKGHRGGMLATAGQLVFHGEADGNLQARDARTGELLWQFQTGAGADAGAAITYDLDGEQYIAIAPSGGESDRATGDVVWAFKLGGTVQPRTPPPAPALARTFSGVVVATPNITIDFSERNKDAMRPPNLQVDDYEAFEPRRARVRPGTRVTWKNTGHRPHTISVRQQTWTTGPIAPEGTGSIQFDTPGTYVYTCENHPWQQGEITVVR
jgi:alcohol dehydrogenase (cytochrome c)